MQLEDMILVSVDDHIIEPPGLFEQHIPKKWAERAPKLVFDEKEGVWTWVWEGGTSITAFINAVVTLPADEWGFDPSSHAEIRPGCYDVDLRVRDMDRNGVLASMCFPTFPGMAGTFFGNVDDKALAAAVLQAYNDWHIDEWAASHPGRFIPLPLCPLWDPEFAAEEVRRVAKKGCTAITFSEDPVSAGFAAPSVSMEIAKTTREPPEGRSRTFLIVAARRTREPAGTAAGSRSFSMPAFTTFVRLSTSRSWESSSGTRDRVR